MKRVLGFILSIVLVLTVCACGTTVNTSASTSGDTDDAANNVGELSAEDIEAIESDNTAESILDSAIDSLNKVAVVSEMLVYDATAPGNKHVSFQVTTTFDKNENIHYILEGTLEFEDDREEVTEEVYVEKQNLLYNTYIKEDADGTMGQVDSSGKFELVASEWSDKTLVRDYLLQHMDKSTAEFTEETVSGKDYYCVTGRVNLAELRFSEDASLDATAKLYVNKDNRFPEQFVIELDSDTSNGVFDKFKYAANYVQENYTDIVIPEKIKTAEYGDNGDVAIENDTFTEHNELADIKDVLESSDVFGCKTLSELEEAGWKYEAQFNEVDGHALSSNVYITRGNEKAALTLYNNTDEVVSPDKCVVMSISVNSEDNNEFKVCGIKIGELNVEKLTKLFGSPTVVDDDNTVAVWIDKQNDQLGISFENSNGVNHVTVMDNAIFESDHE